MTVGFKLKQVEKDLLVKSARKLFLISKNYFCIKEFT